MFNALDSLVEPSVLGPDEIPQPNHFIRHVRAQVIKTLAQVAGLVVYALAQLGHALIVDPDGNENRGDDRNSSEENLYR